MYEQRLKQIGLELPEAASPSFNYVPVTVHRGVANVSGRMPKVDGEVRVTGKVGAEVDLETAQGEARIGILQGLACLKAELGTLDRVERILKVNGYVASAPGFNAQPTVIGVASELLVQVFGEAGRRARRR